MTKLFISHASSDGAQMARGLVGALEAAGHTCWIAPRDVRPGKMYSGEIVAGIRASVGVILLVTPAANASADVAQEVQQAHALKKVIAPVVVEGATPSDDLAYFIGIRHQIPWTTAGAAVEELLRVFPVADKAAHATTQPDDLMPVQQNGSVDYLPWPNDWRPRPDKSVHAYTEEEFKAMPAAELAKYIETINAICYHSYNLSYNDFLDAITSKARAVLTSKLAY